MSTPCASMTAYWTPPPAWPRRVLTENGITCTCSRKGWLIAGTVLLGYFFVMDIVLFSRYQTINLVTDSQVGKPGELYTPVTHLSVKGLLNDHLSQFVTAPSTEYFDMITHFSSIFSFITPNMISIGHFFIGFISGKFMASEYLLDRRVGAILYQFRTWVDAFDGTVHRAQEGLRLQYHSNHSSLGYVIDSTADTLGGCFLSFSILFFLLKKFGHVSTSSQIPIWSKGGDNANDGKGPSVSDTSGTVRDTYSVRYIVWKTVSFGLLLGISGKCWDQSVEDFTNVFQVDLKDPNLSALQLEFSHSYTTLILFYLWRIFGGQSVLNYILIVIYMDKTWDFLQGTQYVLTGIALVLYTITALYINHIRSVLHL